jgi:hypothetical protein
MATVRVKPDVAATVYNFETASYEALTPGRPYDSNDPLVKANAWAFTTDAELDAELDAVEDASAVPGEKRVTRRK